MERTIPTYVVHALMLSILTTLASAALTPDQIARLKQIVLMPTKTGDGAAAYYATLETALQESAEGGAWEVLEMALNSNQSDVRLWGMYFVQKTPIPKTKKRAMLLSAVLNPLIWPDPHTPEGGLTQNTHVLMALYDFQSAFAKSLSETFGTKIEISSVEALWDSEERISMARRLGGEDAVLAIGKPLEAHRVWPPSPRSKQPIDSGNGKENFATTKAAAATLPQRGVHYLWLSAAAALLPGAAWLFLRSRKKT